MFLTIIIPGWTPRLCEPYAPLRNHPSHHNVHEADNVILMERNQWRRCFRLAPYVKAIIEKLVDAGTGAAAALVGWNRACARAVGIFALGILGTWLFVRL